MKRFLIIITLCLFSGIVAAQTADFSYSYANGTPCYPASVQFVNTSTNSGSITAIDWDFGDGSTHYTDLTQDPFHPYTAAGNYTVVLTVHYGNTVRTATKTIRVVTPITFDFTKLNDTICPGESITFNANINSPHNAGSVATYTWNFGDGGQSALASPTYTYMNGGNQAISYDVSLTIFDTNGCSSVVTKTAYVFVKKKPEVDFIASDSIFCYNANQTSGTATFTNLTGATTNNTYFWNFDSAGTSTQTNPTQTFNVGNYSVTLVATSPDGCVDSLTKTNYIQMIQFEIRRTVSDSILCEVPSSVTFRGTNGSSTAYKWTFGDGYEGYSSATSLNHTYRTPGTYTVLIEGTHARGCKAYDTLQMHVYTDIAFEPEIEDTNMCDPSTPVVFKNNTTYQTSDDWGFSNTTWMYGDGYSGTGDSVSHVYGAFGNYEVLIAHTTPYGCPLDTIRRVVHIFPMSAKAAVIVPAPPNPPHGCAPHSVTLENIPDSLVTSSPIVSFTWRWDYTGVWNANDTTSVPVVSGQPPLGTTAHTYDSIGVYQVYVTLTNEQGCTFDVYVNTIMVGLPPVGDFAFDTIVGCKSEVGLQVRGWDVLDSNGNYVGGYPFDAISWIDPATGSPVGSSSRDADSLFLKDTVTGSASYSAPGWQSLQMAPSFNGCAGSGPTYSNVAYVCPPVAAFDITSPHPNKDMTGAPIPYCEFPLIQFHLDQSKVLGTRYVWWYGDGSNGPGYGLSGNKLQSGGDTLLFSAPYPSFQYSDTGGVEPGYIYTLEGVVVATLWAENGDSNKFRDPTTGAMVYPWTTDSINGIPFYDPITNTHGYLERDPLLNDTAATNPHYNPCGYCTDQAEEVLLISDAKMNFTTNKGSQDVYICQGDSLQFWDSTICSVALDFWGFGFTNAADPSHTVVPYNQYLALTPYVRPAFSSVNPVGGAWVTFNDPNTYDVILQDTCAFLCVRYDTLRINVYPRSVPSFVSSKTNSNFSFQRDTLCASNPDTLFLKDRSFTNPPFASLDITSWKWRLNNDTSTLQNPFLLDTFYGLHDLELTIGNEYGCDSTVKVDEYVLVNLVQATFSTGSKVYCNKTPIAFTNNSDVFPREFNRATQMICTWDWGDGSPVQTQIITQTSSSAQKIVAHTYNLPNVTNKVVVTLTVSADGMNCVGVYTDTLTINRPIADFTDDGHIFPCPSNVGRNISFYDNSQGSISWYTWIFGDTASGSSNMSQGANMDTTLHHYTVAATYDVMLVVEDSAGCVDTMFKPSHVMIDGPSGSFTYSPLSGCVNLGVAFEPTLTNTDSVIISPDGGTQVVRTGIAVNNTIRYTYRTPGAYVPYFYLIKWTNDGSGGQSRCVVEWAGEDTIWAIEMQPDFDTNFLYCPKVPVTFPNTTTIQPTLLTLDSALWTYYAGDDSTNVIDGTTIYDSAGVYKVSMTAYSKLCAKTKSYYIEVMEIPDLRFLPDTARACDGLEVSFTMDSTTINSTQISRIVDYQWLFSDGDTLFGHPANREFSASGPYIYDVEVTFTPENCTITYTDTVEIFAYVSPVADFTPNPAEANAGETFNFNDQSIQGDGIINQWNWDFGDGKNGSNKNESHVYENTSGYITVTLEVIDDNGCRSTVQKQVLVKETLAFPNVLTPDAQCGGEPCVFRPIEDKGFFKEFKMEIYDRWGSLIWKNSCVDPNCPETGTNFWWDGRNKQGTRVSDGVYYWVVYGMPLSETGAIILNGSVTVLKGE